MSYDDIMRRYVIDLGAAREEVLVWWEGLRSVGLPGGGGAHDREAAEKAVRARWPLGPVSHPRVIAVYRKYFLETEAYNDAKRAGDAAHADEGFVEPGGLLLDSLEAHDHELSSFMQGFVFTSIGTDPDGNTT